MILVVANVPVYVLVGRLLFRDWENFKGAWLSSWHGRFEQFSLLIRGQWKDVLGDMYGHLLLLLWAVVCAGIVYGETWVIGRLFG